MKKGVRMMVGGGMGKKIKMRGGGSLNGWIG